MSPQPSLLVFLFTLYDERRERTDEIAIKSQRSLFSPLLIRRLNQGDKNNWRNQGSEANSLWSSIGLLRRALVVKIWWSGLSKLTKPLWWWIVLCSLHCLAATVCPQGLCECCECGSRKECGQDWVLVCAGDLFPFDDVRFAPSSNIFVIRGQYSEVWAQRRNINRRDGLKIDGNQTNDHRAASGSLRRKMSVRSRPDEELQKWILSDHATDELTIIVYLKIAACLVSMDSPQSGWEIEEYRKELHARWTGRFLEGSMFLYVNACLFEYSRKRIPMVSSQRSCLVEDDWSMACYVRNYYS